MHTELVVSILVFRKMRFQITQIIQYSIYIYHFLPINWITLFLNTVLKPCSSSHTFSSFRASLLLTWMVAMNQFVLMSAASLLWLLFHTRFLKNHLGIPFIFPQSLNISWKPLTVNKTPFSFEVSFVLSPYKNSMCQSNWTLIVLKVHLASFQPVLDRIG